MSRSFVEAEIEKIVNDKELTFPRNMALSAAWILGNLKGVNLKIFDVADSSSLCDYYVVGSATNSSQAKAMTDEIVYHLKKHGMEVRSKEGTGPNSEWILLDLGDIIVHIFLDSARDFYGLEQLWKIAKTVKIPNHYYFSSDEAEATETTKDDKDRDFF